MYCVEDNITDIIDLYALFYLTEESRTGYSMEVRDSLESDASVYHGLDVTDPLTAGGFQDAENELCHAKTCLKNFALVITKEGLAGTSRAKPTFGMTSTIELY